MTNEEVVQQALHLPHDVRADLALQLIQSLDAEEDSEEEILEAWGQETKRRMEMYKRGEMEMEDWDDVYQSMKARLS